VATALERAEQVDVFARRDVAQRVGLAHHAWGILIQQKNPLDEHVAQAALEEHRGERRSGNLFQSFSGIR
jgi:hypothetical protein